jgi:hypothetical protein
VYALCFKHCGVMVFYCVESSLVLRSEFCKDEYIWGPFGKVLGSVHGTNKIHC